jgi:hypothetical protein
MSGPCNRVYVARTESGDCKSSDLFGQVCGRRQRNLLGHHLYCHQLLWVHVHNLRSSCWCYTGHRLLLTVRALGSRWHQVRVGPISSLRDVRLNVRALSPTKNRALGRTGAERGPSPPKVN